jgi:microcystin-dependent protein
MDPYLGEIRMFGGNFAPVGWALCNGQLLALSQYQALYAILGITYGGDGRTTFGLPNLQSRVPIHWGTGPQLSTYNIGQTGGQENVTLLQTQMPAHTHLMTASNSPATQASPGGYILAQSTDAGVGGSPSNFIEASSANATLAPTALGSAGSSQPHSNLQPFLAVTFIIALEGLFPTRG